MIQKYDQYSVEKRSRGKSSFEGYQLTLSEKKKLGITKYYRPYCIEKSTMLQYKYGYWHIKRILDVCIASSLLVILSPIIAIVMLAIYLEDPHESPVFVQNRIGREGRVFKFYKLRSMYAGAEKDLEKLLDQNEFKGKAFKIKNDPRITKVGKFIRNTSIDELAQLVNIIKGDMSMVGPRPPLPREVEQYDEYEKQRLMVTPGLTCFWQAYPGRHEISFDDWVALDLKYIAEQNMWTDFIIMLQTVKTVLKGNTD